MEGFRIFAILFAWLYVATAARNLRTPSDDNPAFLAENGLVVMNAESVPIVSPWKLETNVRGYTGPGFIRFDGNNPYGGSPNGMLSYFFQIETAGRYRLVMRLRKDGDVSHIANDCYIRVPGQEGYLGQTTKAYLAGRFPRNIWRWFTRLEVDHDAGIFEDPVYNFAPGTYELQVWGRSKNFFIDRIVLYNQETVTFDYARDLARQESRRVGDGPVPTRSPVSSPPTVAPSTAPVSMEPTAVSAMPSYAPVSLAPTFAQNMAPSNSPTLFPTTAEPTRQPSAFPTTREPSHTPTIAPSTATPSKVPTKTPSTTAPSKSPVSPKPSASPTTREPSHTPTNAPSTATPSKVPTKTPSTTAPSKSPVSPKPSSSPTTSPVTSEPTESPISGSPVSSRPTTGPSTAPVEATNTPTEVSSPSTRPSFAPVPSSLFQTSAPTSFDWDSLDWETRFNTSECFSSINTVQIMNGTKRRISDVMIGDYVLTSSGYSRVYSLGHYNTEATADFLQISFNSSSAVLEITRGHLLFVGGTFVRADSVKVGQIIGEDVVTAVNTVRRRGVFAPVTEKGDIYITGVLVSCFASVFPECDGRIQHYMAQFLLLPRRVACMANFGICQREVLIDGRPDFVWNIAKVIFGVKKHLAFLKILLGCLLGLVIGVLLSPNLNVPTLLASSRRLQNQMLIGCKETWNKK